MASLQASLLFGATLLLLLLLPYACTAASTTLETACERYAGGDRGSYDYCLWKLRRANGSAAADSRDLAAIAARTARATAKATLERLAAMRANETVPARRDCLAACAAEYAAAVRRLGRAARDAAGARGSGGGAASGLQRAQNLLAVVAGTPARCDGVFTAAGQDSPIAGADRGLDDEVELVIALLPSPPGFD